MVCKEAKPPRMYLPFLFDAAPFTIIFTIIQGELPMEAANLIMYTNSTRLPFNLDYMHYFL